MPRVTMAMGLRGPSQEHRGPPLRVGSQWTSCSSLLPAHLSPLYSSASSHASSFSKVVWFFRPLLNKDDNKKLITGVVVSQRRLPTGGEVRATNVDMELESEIHHREGIGPRTKEGPSLRTRSLQRIAPTPWKEMK